jgi:hypothetical protein
LQKHDIAGRTVCHAEKKVNDMKTRDTKADWLVPVLGIVLVAVGVAVAASYVDLERKIHRGEEMTAMLDHLYQDQQLSAVLRLMKNGEAAAAARSLDLVLCDNVLLINAQLAAADEPTQVFARDTFARIAAVRPKNPEGGGGAPRLSDDQIAAEKILLQACAENRGAGDGATAAR